MNAPGDPTRVRQVSRGLVRGTAAIAVNRVVDGVVGLLIVPYTLARLGTEAYGLWALLFAVTTYLNLADFGFAASLNRHFTAAFSSGERERVRRALSTGLATMLAIGTLLLAAALALESVLLRFYGASEQFGPAASWAWRGLAATLALGFVTNTFRSALVSQQRADRLALLQTGFALANAGMIVFVLSRGWGLEGLAGGSAALALLRTVVFAAGAGITYGGLPLSVRALDRELLRSMWGFGMTVQLARLAETVHNQFDRVLLGRVLGMRSVTHYDLGAKAASSANLLSQVMLYAIEPAAAALHSTGERERFRELALRAGKYVGLVSFSLMVLLGVAAEPLLALWLGTPPHSNTVLALRVLIIAHGARSLTLPLRLAARGAGRPGWEARWMGVQAAANIALSVGFYYLWGLPGVLAGTLAASLLGQGVLTLRILRGLELGAGRFLRIGWGGPLLAAVLGGLATLPLVRWLGVVREGVTRGELVGPVLAAGLVFLAALSLAALLLRVITVREVRGLADRFRR